MSADNGIYILKTMDSYMFNKHGHKKYINGRKVPAYRVAHISAIDNFDYYKNSSDLTKFYEYLHEQWGRSKVYYLIEDALIQANKLYNEIGYIEYGISKINANEYDFFKKINFVPNKFEQKVIDEKNELEYKLNRLKQFIIGPKFGSFSAEEKRLILQQEMIITNYIDVLNKRIELF